MTALEICLIIIGIAAIAVSYFISEKISEEKLKEAAKELVLGEESRASLQNQTRAAVENILENMTDTIADRTERELEKLSNEKIMSVHDYSNTVLEEINKSHNEIMFLYSMLDDKDKELKNTVREVQSAVKAVRRLESVEVEEADQPEEDNTSDVRPEELSMLLEAVPDEPEEDVKNNNDRILKLHQEGKTNLEIARELGLGLGEVKLVIDLFRG